MRFLWCLGCVEWQQLRGGIAERQCRCPRRYNLATLRKDEVCIQAAWSGSLQGSRKAFFLASFRFLSRNYLVTTSIPIHYHPVLSLYLPALRYSTPLPPSTFQFSLFTLKLLKLLQLFPPKICTLANFVVPLQRETHEGMSAFLATLNNTEQC